MSTPSIDASFQTLGEIVDDLDQGFQGYFFPGLFQGFHIRVRLLARFFFEDRPHGVVKRVQIWAIGRPFTSGVSPMRVDCDDIGAIVPKKVLGLNRFVGWSTILLEGPFFVSKNVFRPREKVLSKQVHVHVAVDLLVDKNQWGLASGGDGGPNHH
uniref:Uncharacterized protein n=1 Tax=Acrobeloides nanus TaxID=290746 RepID=A0A914CRY3_9BILA